jgi:hypothetical protein
MRILRLFDDGAADALTGSTGQDLFFAHQSGGVRDRITDLSSDEIVSELSVLKP